MYVRKELLMFLFHKARSLEKRLIAAAKEGNLKKVNKLSEELMENNKSLDGQTKRVIIMLLFFWHVLLIYVVDIYVVVGCSSDGLLSCMPPSEDMFMLLTVCCQREWTCRLEIQ